MLKADGSKSRPKQVDPGDEAQGAYHSYPDSGDDVDAAFGDGADPPFLTPASAQHCVCPYDETRHAGEREQGAERQNRGHVP